MDITTKHKIASTFLSLSPMGAAQALKNLNENHALKVGEALLQYGHVRFNLSQSLSSSKSQEYFAEDQLSSFVDAYTRPKQQKSNAILSPKSKKNPTSLQDTTQQDSFLRIIADDNSSLEVIKALYRVAYGDKKADALLRKLIHSQLADDFSFLHKYTSKEIYTVVKEESVSIISFVMEVMESVKSASILTMLSEELRGKVILYIAKRKVPNIQACQTIRNVLKDKLKKNESNKERTIISGGVDVLSGILSHMSLNQQQGIINNIQDTTLKKNLERKAINWKLLAKLPKSILEELFQSYSDNEIATLVSLQEEYASELIQLSVSAGRLKNIYTELQYLSKDALTSQKAQELRDNFFVKTKPYLVYIEETIL